MRNLSIIEKKLKSYQKEPFILVGSLIAISIFVFQDFFFLEKLYIYTDIGSDTYYSYWPYLSYLADMIWSGHFSFWSFEFGTGNSVFSVGTLLFDPFNWILFLFGKDSLPYLLPYVATLKIVLAGLFCYKYLQYIRVSNFSSLIISIMYGLNGYIILWGQHYQFATLMFFGIFVLYAFERILQKSKSLLFIFSITVFASFSYYFLYMFTIYLFIYAIFRYIELSGLKIKGFVVFYFKLTCTYIAGICLSSLVFLPSIYVVLNSPRVGFSNNSSFFQIASMQEYLSFIFRLFSSDILGKANFTGYWNYYESPVLYSGLLGVLLIPLFFVFAEKRLKILYGIFLGVIALFIIFPFFSLVFNGFSAYSYRWTFVIILFCILLASRALDLIKQRRVKRGILICLLLGYVIIGLTSIVIGEKYFNWNEGNIKNIISVFSLCFIFILLYLFHIGFLSNVKVKNIGRISLATIVIIEMALFSYITVNSNRNLLSENYLNDNIGYKDGINEVIKYLSAMDDDFYRIDKGFNSVFLNDSLMQNYKGVKAYNSLNHSSYVEFLRVLEVPFEIKNHPNYITGLDSRKKLEVLMGVKYFLDYENNRAPSGFSYLTTINNINVYKNDHYVPFGFTYDSFFPIKRFIELTDYEKDDVLLKSFVIENKENYQSLYYEYTSADHSKVEMESMYKKIEIDRNTLNFKNITVNENHFPEKLNLTATNDDPQMLISFEDIYEVNKIKIKLVIDSQIHTSGQIFWGTNDIYNEQKSFSFSITPDQKEYLIELDNIVFNSLRIDPSNKEGGIILQNINILAESADIQNLKNDATKLKQETLKINEYRNNYIKGTIKTSENKMLFLSIPYDSGWSAKVNGEIVNINKVNIGFIGIDLTEGFHVVELEYNPPLFRIGLYISLSTLIILLVYNTYKKRRKAY